jgi:hypothetical protein
MFLRLQDVFTRKVFNSLPAHSSFDHQINLEESFIPQRGKIYAISPREQKALDEFLEESLSSGRIVRLSSPQAAPFFFQPKAEEVNTPGENLGLRPIQDYRYLNSFVIRDRYPLPLLQEILQAPKFQTTQYYTIIDVRWGFNNIHIREGDEWKAAFITSQGLFELRVMYFGMCNAPSSFQRMMDIILAKLLTMGCVFVYVDDILIAGDNLEELRHWT